MQNKRTRARIDALLHALTHSQTDTQLLCGKEMDYVTSAEETYQDVREHCGRPSQLLDTEGH